MYQMVQKTINRAKNFVSKLMPYFKINDLIILTTGVLSGRASILLGFSPFGVACLGGFLAKDFSPWTSLLPIFGYLISGGDLRILQYILACGIITGLSYKIEWFQKGWLWNTVCAAALLVSGSLYMALFGFDYYSFVMLLIECVLCGVLVTPYRDFVTYFSGAKLRRTMTKEELFAIAVVLFAALSSLSNLTFPFDITLSGVISTFIILFCALEFNTGICAVTGTVLGILAGLSNPNLIFSVGSYSVASIAASLSKRYKKPGVILAFILANAVMTFYINGSTQVLINIYEVIIAGGVLFMIPVKKMRDAKESILLLLPWGGKKENKRMEALKEFTYQRLGKISRAFSGLSASMIKTEQRKATTPEKDVEMIIESVAERVCRNCKNCKFCWKENFEQTYDIVEKLLMVVERRGWVENYDLPSAFKNYCYNSAGIVLETNKVYELYRVNLIWESKVSESKQLISQQLEGVSQVVQTLADELQDNLNFEEETEKNIISILDSLGVKVGGVTVMTELQGRIRVKLNIRDCRGASSCDREILAALDTVTGRNMTRVSDRCSGGDCTVEFKEDENFAVDTAVARVRPKGERTWGDSYAIIRPDDGKLIVALSDGMGTGEEAARESNETVSLLEKLLVAGIDRATAIKLINSVLILKSYDESFATLDMLVFDLYSGEGEFVKTGGVSSYIKRGNKIIEIQSGTLPTGIIGGVEASNYKTTLRHGDIVIIASDGVTEIERNDQWLKELIRGIEQTNAQDIANYIMSAACRGISECIDDMTVIAVRIMEK